MKKLLLIFVLFIGLISCGKVKNDASAESTENDRVEVVYFHGKQRCLTCRAIERFAKETVDSCFANDESVGFRNVDITTPEGEQFADTFEIAGSSLLIIETNNGRKTYEDMTGFAFKNARKNPDVFKKGIETKVKEFLND